MYDDAEGKSLLTAEIQVLLIARSAPQLTINGTP